VTCAVYRLYNVRAELLYVGMSSNPRARFAQHAERQPWWDTVAFYRIEWHATRGAAADVESAAILAEHPMHNALRLHETEPRAASTGDLLTDVARAQRVNELIAIGQPPDEVLAKGQPMRCPAVKRKDHAFTVSNARRTMQPSSWRCILPVGHEGLHQARPSAHQAPWAEP
jgi:predicted GIY-YIG superfamily endonuclease